jgi:two-component system, cell cycle sensor histidine kinase and response regulator CckA
MREAQDMVEVMPNTSRQIVSPRTFFMRILAGVLLVNLFVVVLAGWFLYQSRQQYESRVAIQTQNLAQSLGQTLAGIIDKSNIALFSVEREMVRQIKNGGIDSQSLNHYILEQQQRIPELDGMRIANVRGDVAYGDRVIPGSLVNIADRDFFVFAQKNPMAGLIITKPLFGRNSHKWVFNIVRRINNPDGAFAGIAFGSISLDYLSKIFSSFDLGKNGVITLRDGELTVIVRYPEPRSIGSKTVSREWQALMRAGQLSGTYKTPGSIDRIARIFSYHKVSTYPLFINVGLATSDYLGPWRKEAGQIILLVSLFASGLLLSAWLLYRNRKSENIAEELALERSYLQTLFEHNGTGHLIVSATRQILQVNQRFCEMFGYSEEDLIGQSAEILYLDRQHYEEWAPRSTTDRDGRTHLNSEHSWRRKDGSIFWCMFTGVKLQLPNGVHGVVWSAIDITERKQMETEKAQLEAQLMQSQKMESVGHLAGGIAHDFNNLLTPILGYSELLKRNLPAGSPESAKVDNIIRAADKAKILTQQILSFGRKQILEMKTININHVVTSFHEILRRTIRENIDLRLHLTADEFGVWADKNQIEQIIMNLAVNAQDAIRDTGIITIETAPITLDAEYVRQHAGVLGGNYLMLAVTDSGCGMDPETLSHIFEPFYTTKAIGEGTGLGLATVYGLVKQHGGHIWVYSEIGKGTVFKIYFPIIDEQPDHGVEAVSEQLALNADGRTILLVEDNELVRNLVFDLLESYGYDVIVADGPKEALKLSEGQGIDLLVTDVIMPDMNGSELHRCLLETCPGLKVIYMSGYTNNVIEHHGVLDDGINFIQKPFAVNDLAKKIDAVLNGSMK